MKEKFNMDRNGHISEQFELRLPGRWFEVVKGGRMLDLVCKRSDR